MTIAKTVRLILREQDYDALIEAIDMHDPDADTREHLDRIAQHITDQWEDS